MRGHRITLLTLWADEQERDSIGNIEPLVEQTIAVNLPRWRSLWNCLAAVPTLKPLQTVFCWEPALAHQLNALIQPANGALAFDVVHVEHLRGAEYGLYLKEQLASQGRSLPVVWDSVDSISLLFRQAMVRSKSMLSREVARFELGRTERYESRLLKQFEHVLVTSPSDRRALLALLPGNEAAAPVTVVRNGVDLNYFQPDNSVEREPATLVISGKMSYHANIAMVLNFTQEIMPRVWERRPDARLAIVGKDPPRELKILADHPNITVTGTVLHLPPYLQRATLAVSPLAYGVGIQNKVLEAMACATPVVTSPQAVSALDVRSEQEVLIAEEPAAFASAIIGLLADPQHGRQIGEAGRCYVEKYHNWASAAVQLEEVYAQAERAGIIR